jgi:hypothetical protein
MASVGEAQKGGLNGTSVSETHRGGWGGAMGITPAFARRATGGEIAPPILHIWASGLRAPEPYPFAFLVGIEEFYARLD